MQTPINENGACAPQLSTSPCRSSNTGICHSGNCVWSEGDFPKPPGAP